MPIIHVEVISQFLIFIYVHGILKHTLKIHPCHTKSLEAVRGCTADVRPDNENNNT